jgi:hypothetical protein
MYCVEVDNFAFVAYFLNKQSVWYFIYVYVTINYYFIRSARRRREER